MGRGPIGADDPRQGLEMTRQGRARGPRGWPKAERDRNEKREHGAYCEVFMKCSIYTSGAVRVWTDAVQTEAAEVRGYQAQLQDEPHESKTP